MWDLALIPSAPPYFLVLPSWKPTPDSSWHLNGLRCSNFLNSVDILEIFLPFLPLLAIIIIINVGTDLPPPLATRAPALSCSLQCWWNVHSPFLFTRSSMERSQSPPWETEGVRVGVSVWLVRREFRWFPLFLGLRTIISLSCPLFLSIPGRWLFLHVIALSFLYIMCGLLHLQTCLHMPGLLPLGSMALYPTSWTWREGPEPDSACPLFPGVCVASLALCRGVFPCLSFKVPECGVHVTLSLYPTSSAKLIRSRCLKILI